MHDYSFHDLIRVPKISVSHMDPKNDDFLMSFGRTDFSSLMAILKHQLGIVHETRVVLYENLLNGG